MGVCVTSRGVALLHLHTWPSRECDVVLPILHRLGRLVRRAVGSKREANINEMPHKVLSRNMLFALKALYTPSLLHRWRFDKCIDGVKGVSMWEMLVNTSNVQ